MTQSTVEKPLVRTAEPIRTGPHVRRMPTTLRGTATDVTTEVNREFGHAHVAEVVVVRQVAGSTLPSGVVTVVRCGVMLASAAVVDGRATLTWVEQRTGGAVMIDYDGDATNAPCAAEVTPVVAHPGLRPRRPRQVA